MVYRTLFFGLHDVIFLVYRALFFWFTGHYFLVYRTPPSKPGNRGAAAGAVSAVAGGRRSAASAEQVESEGSGASPPRGRAWERASLHGGRLAHQSLGSQQEPEHQARCRHCDSDDQPGRRSGAGEGSGGGCGATLDRMRLLSASMSAWQCLPRVLNGKGGG